MAGASSDVLGQMRLAGAAAGLDNGTIAGRLSLSVKTVSHDVSNVFAKLHVDGRWHGDRPRP